MEDFPGRYSSKCRRVISIEVCVAVAIIRLIRRPWDTGGPVPNADDLVSKELEEHVGILSSKST